MVDSSTIMKWVQEDQRCLPTLFRSMAIASHWLLVDSWHLWHDHDFCHLPGIGIVKHLNHAARLADASPVFQHMPQVVLMSIFEHVHKIIRIELYRSITHENIESIREPYSSEGGTQQKPFLQFERRDKTIVSLGMSHLCCHWTILGPNSTYLRRYFHSP